MAFERLLHNKCSQGNWDYCTSYGWFTQAKPVRNHKLTIPLLTRLSGQKETTQLCIKVRVVGMDYLLVGVFHMGVQGAAWATVITQLTSAVLCFLYFWKKYPSLRIHRNCLKTEKALSGEMIPSGMSMGFMLSFVLLGSLVLQTSINALGQNIIVAHTSARKITILLLLPFFALGTALSTYCSQNLGAKLYLRITQGINTSVLIAAAWWVLSLAFVWLVGDKMIMLITASQDLEIVTNAVQYLRINSALFMLPALICILRNSMQGFGDTRTPLISTQNPNNGH